MLIFYDNGCSDFVVSKKAIELLGSKAKKISSEPVILGGVGECQTKSLNGIFNVTIPLHDDQEVTFSGVCLDRITSTFPTYPLDIVEQDIIDYHISSGGTSPIPKASKQHWWRSAYDDWSQIPSPSPKNGHPTPIRSCIVRIKIQQFNWGKRSGRWTTSQLHQNSSAIQHIDILHVLFESIQHDEKPISYSSARIQPMQSNRSCARKLPR